MIHLFFNRTDNAICFVDQNTGNDTNTLCGTVLYPCMTIQTCINQMQNETGEATVMLQSNITAIPGNYSKIQKNKTLEIKTI